MRGAKNDLARFLDEDLASRGDVTTERLFGKERHGARARIFAREPVVAAGIDDAAAVFRHLGAKAKAMVAEGRLVQPARSLVTIDGPLQSILTGERLALNILARMCGIATTTRRLADQVAAINPRCRVAATRKTTPGFRSYEKRAVAVGGGDPHRFGLFDQVLIKDNHLDALGGDVALAIRRARGRGARLPVEVEVSTIRDARVAAREGADWILIDNVAPAAARRISAAARAERSKVRIEISGGLTEANLARYAPYADRLSMGALTHSARSADVTLELSPKR